MSTVASRLPHRDALLAEGMRQLFDAGYHGMTVDGVLEATAVPKGSFYHHFGSKESFVAAVLDQYGGFHTALLSAWASRELTAPQQIAGYFRELTRIFVDSGFRHGDLAGKLATETTSAASTPLHAQIARLVHAWRTQLQDLLAEGQRRGTVRTDRSLHRLSAGLHALADGAFVVAMSTRDEASLVAVADAIERLIAVPTAVPVPSQAVDDAIGGVR